MRNKNVAIGLGIVVVAVIVVAIVAATGGKKDKMATMPASSSSSSSVDTSQAVATNAVDIKNFAFATPVIKVKVGTTVTWTNQDDVHHNVVADTPSADAPNGPLIGKGETYQFTFKKAGTYTYHCMPHTYMHGTVVVTE